MGSQATYDKNGNDLAVGYVRVSTREQADSGLSLELQGKAIGDYCKYNKIRLYCLISDPGESGKDLNRSGIRKVIQMCSNRQISHVVVYKMDRLTRRTMDLLMLVEKVFTGNGVEFHSICEKIDTDTSMGKFYLTIIGAFSQMQRDYIAERTIEALRQKKERGEPVGCPPYGYVAGNGGRYEKCGVQMKVIKRIRRLRREGYSYKAIADTLNSQNIPTKRGGFWSSGTVRYVLTNDNYKKLAYQKKSKTERFSNIAGFIR